MEAKTEVRQSSQGCFDKTSTHLTVNDVFQIATVIGTEVEKLIDSYGKESVESLVRKIVKVLEHLENFASRNQAHIQREEELLKTFETIQLQQQKRRGGKDTDNSLDKNELLELQAKEQRWKKKCEELQIQVQQLKEDIEDLQSRLKGNHAQEDRVQRQEREVMLKLKQVVDKQRDEIRAKVQENSTISKEVEALQEQLDRFMKMNAELRHKQNVLQAQLTTAVERKADMEADLKEKSKVIERLQAQPNNSSGIGSSSPSQTSQESIRKSNPDHNDQEQPCFTKKDVRDILFERNELKTNLFLVEEELNYYKREILNEERCPGFLLEAVRSSIKRRRRLIKAKMLGIPLNESGSSDEEEGISPLGQTEVDGPEAELSDKPAESRIRNLFGLLTRSGSSKSPTHMSSSASTWEIIGDSEACEQQQ